MQPPPFGRSSKNSDILSAFKSAQIANVLVAKTQPASIKDFQLGNEIFSYLTPSSTENSLSDRSSASGCYLVFEGQVRLLCQNLALQRPVSADLLEAGAVFGADHLFCEQPLPYWVIATSSCRLVHIPYRQLSVQLEQVPQLQTYLSQGVQQRERLIFFKRFTQQRSLPIHTLKHALLPELVEQRVEAGANLSQVLPNTGYFWLRAGQILNRSNPAPAPEVGDGWGYPDAIPEGWVAQTDLIIYTLPLGSWKTLNLLQR
ncbi:cyclic nucleotide-binding domain-containing protein [Egbenema bharatensis]|uniref:cyclic nucleotide-binding domain-containing protein n=1 Tax=Egbenema bharatensis TaxID=3463334 RepID=UPI003A86B28C